MKQNIPEKEKRARTVRALTNVHARELFSRLSAKFPIKERALVCGSETSRENTAPRAITPLTLRGPSITTRYPRSAKSPFSLPTHIRARARARTADGDDDASSSSGSRAQSPLRPLRPKILNAGASNGGVERRSRSRERPFTPSLHRAVVVHANNSVARAAGGGGTPLDDGDDAGTSSLPLSTHSVPHSRARASRAVCISGGKEKKKRGKHDARVALARRE